jgi:DnaJ-class molecular chaperone
MRRKAAEAVGAAYVFGTNIRPMSWNKPSPQVYTVHVTLEQMDTGVKLHHTYEEITRRVTAGNTVSKRLLTAVVAVPMGAMDGERIVHPGQGYRYGSAPPADLVFVLKTRPSNTFFARNGADLYVRRTITPEEATAGVEFEFRTVFGTTERVQLEAPIADRYEKRIVGCGMRRRETSHGGPDDERGDVIVRVRIQPSECAVPEYI